MKTFGWIACAAGLALALVAGLFATRGASAAEDEESALLHKRCGAFVDAWNKHDAKGMAAAFAEDGDAIAPDGRHATGRAELEKMFAADHGPTGPMRESKVEVLDEPVRLMKPDVGVSDAEITLSGVIGPDGKKLPAMKAHVTNVWKKADGEWWVYANRPYVHQ